MMLMIDNYDSFTYNLVQYLGELGADVTVRRNDRITLNEIEALDPEKIIISPGPCTPNESGISVASITHFATSKPILGVCLGHQCIAQAFGGRIIRARHIMHGKTSLIYHNNSQPLVGLPNPFQATRYHSLIVEESTLPDCLDINAWTQHPDGSRDEIMGIAHQCYPVVGMQFHPESILTPQGHDILSNFLHITSSVSP